MTAKGNINAILGGGINICSKWRLYMTSHKHDLFISLSYSLNPSNLTAPGSSLQLEEALMMRTPANAS